MHPELCKKSLYKIRIIRLKITIICTINMQLANFTTSILDVIEDVDARRNAVTLSLLIDWQIMFDRYGYQSVDDLIDTILLMEKNFFKMLKING